MESTPEMESMYKLPESVHFYPDKGTLLLDIEASSISIPDEVSKFADQHDLKQKDEFHITIFGFNEGKKIKEVLVDKEKDQKLMQLIQDADWSYRETPDFYMVEKSYTFKAGEEDRETIIMKIDMPGLDEFFLKASAILGIMFPDPMPHLTLYSRSTNPQNMLAGIGINSEDNFLTLNPEKINV